MDDQELNRRLRFDAKLKEIFDGNVYFQPPETMKIKYPCIIYFKTSVPVRYANNLIYKHNQSYTVTYVDTDPDAEMPFKILKAFEYARIDSFYKSEGLNHTKLTIYF